MTTTARRSKGLDAIRDAAIEATPTVHVLILGDVPRTGLTVREVSKITGLSYDRLCDDIHAGHIEVITGGAGYIIPVDQLAVIRSWARRLNPTA